MKSSPLVSLDLGTHSTIYAMREDLQKPAGGNKVRRFRAFLDRRPDAERIVALSDPGSHTFLVLSKMQSSYPHIKEWIFLERRAPVTKYQEKNRRHYMNKEGIFVKTDAFLFQLIKREKYRRRNDLTTYFLGIGGSTNEDPNPFIEAFHECERQISRKTSGLVHHLLPVASGEMLQGLVEGANTVSGEHQFTAVYTGDPLGKHRMEWKWKKTSNVEILHPAGSGEEVEKTINSFYQATSIRLDPIHTGRAVHQWMHELPKSLPTVLWITNPYIFG